MLLYVSARSLTFSFSWIWSL